MVQFTDVRRGTWTALLFLTALLTLAGMVLAPPASAHHKPNHQGGPPPHSNAGGNGNGNGQGNGNGNGQGQGPYGGQTCTDGGKGQGHQQHGNGNGHGHCKNEGNPGHGGTPPGHGGTNPGKGRSGFSGAETVAPCSTVVIAGSGWQPGAPVQLGGGFDGTGCTQATAAQGISAPPATTQTGNAVADEAGNVYAEVTVPADAVAGEERALLLEGTAMTGEPRTDSYLYEIIPTVVTTTQASTTAVPTRADALIAFGLLALMLLGLATSRMVRRLRTG